MIEQSKDTDSLFSGLVQKQQALENLSVDRGRLRFQDRIQKNKAKQKETASGAVRNLLRESLLPVEEAIELVLETQKAKRGPKPVWVKFFTTLGSDVAAYLTGIAILDSISSKISASKMCLKIAGLMIDELRYRKFREVSPGLFDWKLRNFNDSSYTHMKRSMDASITFSDIDVSEYDLDVTQRMHLGSKALDLFVAATGYVEIRRTATAKKQRTDVCATDKTVEWIQKTNSRFEEQAPIFMPMLIPPRPWGDWHPNGKKRIKGGYWFALSGRFDLLRAWGEGDYRKNQIAELDSLTMPTVYTALNALQETSYLINERVLAVMEKFKIMGVAVAGMPSYEDEPLPPRPEDIDDNPVARKEWRRQAHIVYEANHERKCEAIRFSKILTTVNLMLQETEPDVSNTDGSTRRGRPLPFYFPYNLDFRGRAYPIPVYLQPQGDDICRGLLTFGEGRPLGSNEAVDWLAIHGANQLGKTPQGESLDKGSFEDRIQWIENHTEEICAIADDPVSSRDLWINAESPWQYLAFCFEWADFIRSGRSLNFVSYLPVSMDGSCNGLQHYAALMKDEELAKAVNLIPSSTPQDIYKTVAAEVVRLLQADAMKDGDNAQFAKDWLAWGKIDRKFVKRQVMTLPYGSKKYGFREQVKEFLKKLDSKDRPTFFSTASDGFKHVNYISHIVWASLAQTSGAAIEAMEYFQQCARLAARSSAGITWTPPNGLAVFQAYPETESVLIKTESVLAGSAFRPRVSRIKTTPQGGQSWMSPAGLPVTQAYPEIQAVQVKTTLEGSIFKPVVNRIQRPPDYYAIDRGKQVSGIAPNIIHSLDAAAMMLTVEAATEQGLTHFLMIHDSYGTHAAEASKLSRLLRATFMKMYSGNTVLTNLHSDFTSNIDSECLREGEAMPEMPSVGSLELSQIQDAAYFFA